MREKIGIGNIGAGMLAEAIEEALARIASDVIDRPSESRPRTIKVKIAMTPRPTLIGGRTVNNPEVAWEVQVAEPRSVQGTAGAFVRQEGKQAFVMVDTDNPHLEGGFEQISISLEEEGNHGQEA